MAYTIISQNNNTTTLSDGVNTITVPSRVNLTSGNFTIVEVNNNMATLEDGDGNVYRDIPCVATLAGEGGGGGAVDYSKTVQKTNTMPTADATNAGQVFMYTGATDANYTTNYIYKNVKSATYTGTVSFEAATLSGTTVACSGDNFANFLTESGVEPLSVVSGTMTFDSASELWALVGKDSDGNTVLTFQEYQQDFVDAGFTFTGTPQDGDVVAFTCTVEEASATYTWTRVDVQPTPEALPDQTGHSGEFLTTDGTDASWAAVKALPDQTGQSGKFLTTDGTAASWAAVNALQNTATGTDSLTILGTATTQDGAINIGNNSAVTGTTTGAYAIAIGYNAKVTGANTANAIAIGRDTSVKSNSTIVIGNSATSTITNSRQVIIGSEAHGYAASNSIAIGTAAVVNANNNIQLNSSGLPITNADANTFKVANNNGNFEIMDANGNLPADRLASTTGLADGNYRLRLTMTSGVPTLSWVAE